MDSNKDEAERCIELAERYIKEKKLKDAEKFLRKAKKLYPTQKAEGERITRLDDFFTSLLNFLLV